MQAGAWGWTAPPLPRPFIHAHTRGVRAHDGRERVVDPCPAQGRPPAQGPGLDLGVAMLAMGAASLTVPHGPNWVAAYVGGLGISAAGLRRARHQARRSSQARKNDGDVDDRAGADDVVSLLPGGLMHDILFGGRGVAAMR